METTFGECTDNEKKGTVISDCSEMRTEGTSRPSVGLVRTSRDDHLPASIPGVMIRKIRSSQWRYCTKKHVFGVVLATRERNRKSQPALCGIFLVDLHARFEAQGPRLRLSQRVNTPPLAVTGYDWLCAVWVVDMLH